MIYPKYINEKSNIGVCAPSAGITNEIKHKRLDNAKLKFNSLGNKIIETNSVRTCVNGRSNSIDIRVKELMSLYTNKDIELIICATGGEFLLEILPYIDFDIIKNNIKWLQGYSDPTALLFTITTNYDIATIYSYNFGTYGMDKWHKSVEDSIKLVSGKINTQYELDYYEDGFYDYETGLEGFHQDKIIEWKNLNRKDINIKGRIIGGCIDIIMSLIGTKFDNTKNFIEKYKEDGIIWYFDNCELSYEDLTRALWQLKNAGWFKYSNGIIFGRSMCNSSYFNNTIDEILNNALDDLNIPIIYDFDIGHKHPQVSIINGSIATVVSNEKEKYIVQELL